MKSEPLTMNDTSTMVRELFENHKEALFIGLTNQCAQKPTITIYSKTIDRDGNLLSYVKAILEELVKQYERQTTPISITSTTEFNQT